MQIRPKMRKRILAWTRHSPAEPGWLDPEGTALIEITSEDIAFPIESARLQRETEAGAPPSRVQKIRLIFDQPQSISQISAIRRKKEDSTRAGIYSEILARSWKFFPGNHTAAAEV